MKLLLVAGARPNFMKIAPLIHAIQRHNARLETEDGGPRTEDGGRKTEDRGPRTEDGGRRTEDSGPPSVLRSPISYKLVHTGQHYDETMSEVFFRDLGIPAPDFNLEVGSGSHAVQTANILTRFEPVLLNAFSAESESVVSGPSSALRPPSSLVSSPVVSGQSSSVVSGPPSSALRPPSSAPAPSALPDWLIVVGDVNSTMACTLVASKLGVRVAHVEAGLRSFDRTMPEEINRLVTDGLADLLLTPSTDADDNLRREGVAEDKIKLVGNIMIDSLMANLPQARASKALENLNLEPGRFVYVTLHRPSNVDNPENLRRIMAELTALSARLPVVFPIHPRTRHRLAEFQLSADPPSMDSPPSSVLSPPSSAVGEPPVVSGDSVSASEFPLSALSSQPSEGPSSVLGGQSSVLGGPSSVLGGPSSVLGPRSSVVRSPALLLLEPLGYHDSLCLAEHARLVLTDSGGLQEETTYFRTPCLTLRPNTERPITITCGSNRLTTLAGLSADIQQCLRQPARVGNVPDLWDGRTAERIIETLACPKQKAESRKQCFERSAVSVLKTES